MITDLGKLLRILRINKGDNAKDMADKLSISPTYLSAIENGKRNVPHGFYDSLNGAYELSITEQNSIKSAIAKSVDKIEIDVTDLTQYKKEVLMALSRHDFDDNTVRLLSEIIKKKEKM